METIQKSLALFKQHRLIFLGLNLLMIIAGALVISHRLSNDVILVAFLSVFSGIVAALDTWLIICLVRLFLNHFTLLNNWLKAIISMTTGLFIMLFMSACRWCHVLHCNLSGISSMPLITYSLQSRNFTQDKVCSATKGTVGNFINMSATF